MTKQYDLIIFDWNGTLSTGLVADKSAGMPPLFPEVKNILNQLNNSGILLAIATMASKQTLLQQLQLYHIEKYFVAFSCGDDGYSKPHPGVIQLILQQTGVSAAHALMVGDAEVDMECAHYAGIDGVKINKESHSSHHQCLSHISQLLDWLEIQY